MNIEKIIKASVKEVFVFWSESNLVNDRLGCKESAEINKAVSLAEFEKVANEAAQFVEFGYDKTKVEVRFHDGEPMQMRLDINKKENSLVELIKLYID